MDEVVSPPPPPPVAWMQPVVLPAVLCDRRYAVMHWRGLSRAFTDDMPAEESVIDAIVQHMHEHNRFPTLEVLVTRLLRDRIESLVALAIANRTVPDDERRVVRQQMVQAARCCFRLAGYLCPDMYLYAIFVWRQHCATYPSTIDEVVRYHNLLVEQTLMQQAMAEAERHYVDTYQDQPLSEDEYGRLTRGISGDGGGGGEGAAEVCVLCMEDCVPGEGVVRLPCGHEFHDAGHDACAGLKQWVLRIGRCPQCRSRVLGDANGCAVADVRHQS